jgi:predicted DNA-binding transcriptional regulator AlpA
MGVDLATLAADPERIQNVPAEALPALIGETEALRARLWAKLQTAAPAPAPAPERANGGQPDTLLKASDAAERLGVSKRWMYAHADTLPFTRRLTGGTLRFSSRGMEKWKERR